MVGDRLALKMRARVSMRESKTNIFLAGLVYFIITYVLQMLVNELTQVVIEYNEYNQIMRSLDYERLFNIWYEQRPSGTEHLLAALVRVMTAMITAGWAYFCLRTARGEENSLGNLFDVFSHFLRIIGLNILVGLVVALWSILLVVPGIIASYRYRMAMYILLDDPQKSILQCMRESRALMDGRKADLFVLDLSFIGWRLLSLIPFVSVYVAPYVDLTMAHFYLRSLSNSKQEQENPTPWEL